VVCTDAIKALTQPESVGIPVATYQIVTLCPPYEEVVFGDLLEAVIGSELLLGDDTVVQFWSVTAREHTAVGVLNRRHGRTVTAMYVVNPTGSVLTEAASSRPEESEHSIGSLTSAQSPSNRTTRTKHFARAPVIGVIVIMACVVCRFVRWGNRCLLSTSLSVSHAFLNLRRSETQSKHQS